MGRKLLLASAGAGKSAEIVGEALRHASKCGKVLLLTYTINNQHELVRHICQLNRVQPANVVIKGWFSFLLEDMVRPYQRCIVPERIAGVFLNQSNPHLVEGHISRKGTKEALERGGYNWLHYVTKSENLAHSFYLAKLATRINEVTGGKPTRRLCEIYKAIFVDEVQDLVGWDYEVLRAVLAANVSHIECVGDFRQSIYQTSETTKKPQSSADKLNAFREMNFEPSDRSISWRCVQSICDLADRLHADEGLFQATQSKVDRVPNEFADHCGVFAIRSAHINKYIELFNPVILRWSRSTCPAFVAGRRVFNFGESKGSGFDRVLVIPTAKQAKFLQGDKAAFAGEKTDDARNKLYVGITRARYSVAFLHDGERVINGAEIWRPTD